MEYGCYNSSYYSYTTIYNKLYSDRNRDQRLYRNSNGNRHRVSKSNSFDYSCFFNNLQWIFSDLNCKWRVLLFMEYGSDNCCYYCFTRSTTTYTVTVSDGNGCSGSSSATVNVITGVGITETHVEPTTCVSANGSINITATGLGGFTYFWSTPNGSGLIPTNEDQTGLTVGTYNVTVTSSNGCTGTKSIVLVGPGNCAGCPIIGTLSKSVNNVCKTTNFTLTASGLVNMGVTYGITFKYSLAVLPNPYVGGTVLGTVPNSGLTGGGTLAVLTANIPSAGNYFIYAILDFTPPDPTGRHLQQIL